MGGRLNQARHRTLQEVQHSPVEGFRLLDVAEAPGGGDEHTVGYPSLAATAAAPAVVCRSGTQRGLDRQIRIG
jgi:hypothetical protein